ncbi:MAG: SRPBCC domain-containing protein [Acidimicrobiia bacterium]|nr:SRPBCC domain-containing protein [Acidimicrobiia bacterium]
MSKPESMTLTQEVAAPAAEVYRQFTNSTLLRGWLCDAATLRAEEGGRLYLGWNHGYGVVGNFTALVPGKQVAFTWVGPTDPGPSAVDVTLESKGNTTTVKLTHTWPGGEGWEQFAKGVSTWAKDLENLASVMTTGEDLRFTRRPMIGVMVDTEITPERAAKLGAPVDYGVRLAGTSAGMGAHAAGLTGGDIVVGIGGTNIVGFPSFAVALQPHRAGDVVEVVYYRDGSERRAEMKLSGRPIPELPATAAALAEFVAGEFRWVDEELGKVLEGVTEVESTTRPSPDEWSVREVIAHLLNDEGDSHAFIADLVIASERVTDGPFENSNLRGSVTAASFDSLAEMVAAYQRLERQTVAMLAALPGEFVARKGGFWRLAYGYSQGRDHYQEHFEQIRATVATLRGGATK